MTTHDKPRGHIIENPHPYRIRRAGAADAAWIARIHVLAWQEAYRGILPGDLLNGLSADERSAMWARILERGDTHVLVAEDGEETVGFIALGAARDEGSAPGTAEVYALYTLPARWSSGVGRALWQAGHRRLVEAGFSTAALWVLAANERAIRFYERAGFERDVEAERLADLEGCSLAEVRYATRLRPATRPTSAP